MSNGIIEFDVTVTVRKHFIVRTTVGVNAEMRARMTAESLILDGPESITADDLTIDLEQVEV